MSKNDVRLTKVSPLVYKKFSMFAAGMEERRRESGRVSFPAAFFSEIFLNEFLSVEEAAQATAERNSSKLE